MSLLWSKREVDCRKYSDWNGISSYNKIKSIVFSSTTPYTRNGFRWRNIGYLAPHPNKEASRFPKVSDRVTVDGHYYSTLLYLPNRFVLIVIYGSTIRNGGKELSNNVNINVVARWWILCRQMFWGEAFARTVVVVLIFWIPCIANRYFGWVWPSGFVVFVVFGWRCVLVMTQLSSHICKSNTISHHSLHWFREWLRTTHRVWWIQKTFTNTCYADRNRSIMDCPIMWKHKS